MLAAGREGSDPLQLQLQTVVNDRASAGTRTQVFCKQQVLFTAEPTLARVSAVGDQRGSQWTLKPSPNREWCRRDISYFLHSLDTLDWRSATLRKLL